MAAARQNSPSSTQSTLEPKQNSLYHHEELIEYNVLVKMFHDYPRDPFIPRLIQMYSSSETDLEIVRARYFDVVKQEHEEFPFGLDAELKRRVYRANGEPIPVKLAQDIYTIISVSQGEDYNSLRDMISSRRSASIAASKHLDNQPRTQTIVGRNNGTSANRGHLCQCATELTLLKDTVSSLQAGFLNLSQNLHASDKLRAGQMEYVKAELKNIKWDILESKQEVRRVFLETGNVLNNHQEVILKDELLLHERISKLENFIDTNKLYHVERLPGLNIPFVNDAINEPIGTFGNMKVPTVNVASNQECLITEESQLENFLTTAIPSDGVTAQNISCEPQYTMDTIPTTMTPLVTDNDIRLIEPPTYEEFMNVAHNPGVFNEHLDGTAKYPSSFPYESTDTHHDLSKSGNQDDQITKTYSNVNVVEDATPGTAENPIIILDDSSEANYAHDFLGIPMVFTPERNVAINNQTSTCHVTENNEKGEFQMSSRRRTRHFCVLGYNRSITRDKLYSFINNGGFLVHELRPGQAPTVTNIRIFPMRRFPNKLVIRVNVTADYSAELLLNERFWPMYVTCEQWRSRASKQRSGTQIQQSVRVTPMHAEIYPSNTEQLEKYGFSHRNPFAELECDVD